MIKEVKCVTGCMNYTGGEIRHHKDCPFYPESLSKKYDEMDANQDKWISVKDRLPDSGQRVWLYGEGMYESVFRFWGVGYNGNPKPYFSELSNRSSIGLDEDVTHWQPLPNPPKQ
jgi:hypothetical protein